MGTMGSAVTVVSILLLNQSRVFHCSVHISQGGSEVVINYFKQR